MQLIEWIGSTLLLPVGAFFSDDPWRAFIIGSVAAVVAVWYLSRAAAASRQRALELDLAARALTEHYSAMEKIIDDPALPVDALEMLTFFSEAIASREFCDGLTDALVEVGPGEAKPHVPHWFDELQALRKSRVDVVENFHKAIGSGLAAAFLRWPDNSPKLVRLAAILAADTQREAIFAEQVSARKRGRNHDRNHSNHGGFAVPA